MTISLLSTATASTTAATLTIAKPIGSGAAGDFLIAILGYYNQAAPVTGPGGWTKLDEGQHTGQTYNMASIWYRVCDGSEGDSFSWTFGGSLDEQHGGIMAFTGVDATTPIQTWSEKLDGSSDQLTAAGITVTTAPTMLVFMGGCNASGFNNTQSTTPPTGYAEAIEVHGTSYGGVYAAYKGQATTGATGNVAAFNSAAVAFVTYLIALNEATAGTTRNLYANAQGTTGTAAAGMAVARPLATAASMATNTANANLATGATGDNPITFGTPTTASRGTAGTSLVINTPTNIAGDVIYLGWASDGDGDTGTPPTGFTAVTNYNGLGLGVGPSGVFYLWSKVSTGSEPATYTITNTVAERSCAIAFAVRNQASIHAYGTTQSNTSGSSTTATAPGVTTTITGAMRVSIIASNAAVNPVSTLSGHTELGTASQASGGTVNVQYKALPTATTDASATATFTAGGGWVGITFAIAPTQTGSSPVVNFAANAQGATSTNGAAVSVARPLLVNRAGATATGTSTLYITRKLLGAVDCQTATAGVVLAVTRPLLTGAAMATATADAVLAVARVFAYAADGATATPDAALDNTRSVAGASAAATETPDVALGFIRSLLFSRAMITGTGDPSLAVTRALVGAASVLASTPDPTLHLTLGLLASAAAASSTGAVEVRVGRSLAAAGSASSATGEPTLIVADLVSLLVSASAASNTAPAGLRVSRPLAAATAAGTATGSPALHIASLIQLLAAAAAETIAPTPGLAVARPLALSAPAGSATASGALSVVRPLVALSEGTTGTNDPRLDVLRVIRAAAAAHADTPAPELYLAKLVSLLAAATAFTDTPAPRVVVARRMAVSGASSTQTGIAALSVLRPLVAAHPGGTGATTEASTAALSVLRALAASPTAPTATSTPDLAMYLIVGLLRATIAAKRPGVTAQAKN